MSPGSNPPEHLPFLGFVPQPQELRARKVGHVLRGRGAPRLRLIGPALVTVLLIVNTPRYPVATKRALRAFLKAADICSAEPERVARYLDLRHAYVSGEGIIRRLEVQDHPFDGFLLGKRYLLHDRDTKFTQAFDGLVKDSGLEPIVLPPRSPNLNAHCERFVRSIKEEALNRMVMVGAPALSYVIHQYLAHYHAERNH
jgi:Integrase core domain